MGRSTTSVSFFDSNIKLDVHTATHVEHIRRITLEAFADGSSLRLDRCEETGEFTATRVSDGAFIEGPEI